MNNNYSGLNHMNYGFNGFVYNDTSETNQLPLEEGYYETDSFKKLIKEIFILLFLYELYFRITKQLMRESLFV